jgi:hypothetical protein
MAASFTDIHHVPRGRAWPRSPTQLVTSDVLN